MRPSSLRLIAIALCAVFASVARAAAQEEAPSIDVVVVPIHGPIGVPTVALVSRAMREARSLGAGSVVLDVDTMGGLQDSMEEIETVLNSIREGRPLAQASPAGAIRLVSFVRKDAWSAGGYIALACDETFMTPVASIGAIMPVLVGPEGMRQIPDEDVRSKVYSALRARVRALAERRGLPPSSLLIAEAMVDPRIKVFEITYRDANRAEVTEIMDESGIDRLTQQGFEILDQRILAERPPLTLTANQALLYGFSNGTYASLSDLVREEFGVADNAVYRVEESWSETAVAWLESMKPLLFLIGFILLLVEAKVPGVAIPGVLGVAFIALGLFSSYLVGLAEWQEILLFFVGLILIGVEIFVMPGTLVFGFLGFVAVVFSLVLSQQSFFLPNDSIREDILLSNLFGLLVLTVLVIVGAVLFYRFMPMIPFFNRALLQPPVRSSMTGASTRFAKDGAPEPKHLVGVVAVAATDLRPAGIVEVDGERFDVVTTGSFVGRGERVRVIRVEGNRIVVEQASESGEVALGLLFLLLVVGLCLIVAEVFFVSFGVLSIGAAVSLISAVFLAFTHHSQGFGFLFLGLSAIGAPLCIAYAMRILPKTSLGRKLLLSGPARETVRAAAEQHGIHGFLGREGVTLSVLRPTGFARIGDERVDVVTRGEMIEADVPVRVIHVEGNRVVVAATNPTNETES